MKTTGEIGQILGVRVSSRMDDVRLDTVFTTKAWNLCKKTEFFLRGIPMS
jgi:hypothetical protein